MIEVGILKNFNSGTYKAGVQLAGSLTTYFDGISVARNIPSSALVIGNYVILAIPGGNPKDACVIATWPSGSVNNLDDLADVSVAAPADDDLFYYDDATSLWKARKLVDADIPAGIARDTEVTTAVAAEAAARVADVDAEEAARIAADAAHADLTEGVHAFDKSCRVNHSAAQTLTTGVVLFSAFDTEVWDTDVIHDTATNNTRLTCKTAGKYMIAGGGQFVANATGRRHVQIKLNGATVIAGQHLQAVTDANGVTSLALTTIYALAVNDYVELGFYQASGGDLVLQGGQPYSPWFAMARIA